MKQQVLKALANPARIFYVPYSLAVFNFVVQFMIFIIIFIIEIISGGIDGGAGEINPIYFFVSVCAVHFILVFYSKKEPQLMQIILAKIKLFGKFIPRILRV